MKRRILGRNFELSALGLGCMRFSHAYGAPSDRKEAVEMLARSVEK